MLGKIVRLSGATELQLPKCIWFSGAFFLLLGNINNFSIAAASVMQNNQHGS